MKIDMIRSITYKIIDGEPCRLISITLEEGKIVVRYRDAHLDFMLRNFPERVSKYHVEGMEPLLGHKKAVWRRRKYPILYKRDRMFYFMPHEVIPCLGISNVDVEEMLDEAKTNV